MTSLFPLAAFEQALAALTAQVEIPKAAEAEPGAGFPELFNELAGPIKETKEAEEELVAPESELPMPPAPLARKKQAGLILALQVAAEPIVLSPELPHVLQPPLAQDRSLAVAAQYFTPAADEIPATGVAPAPRATLPAPEALAPIPLAVEPIATPETVAVQVNRKLRFRSLPPLSCRKLKSRPRLLHLPPRLRRLHRGTPCPRQST